MPVYTVLFYLGCRLFVFGEPAALAAALPEERLRFAFGAALVVRLLYPQFNSPFSHLFSDPARHWENGQRFLDPTFMGATDPYLYQLWLYLLGRFPGDVHPVVLAATGLLCALMPYGWYRALKERVPRRWALGGALIIALLPGFIGIYGYFMNETLILSLTGFAFWATFRAYRKGTVGAFLIACALWLAAGFTRSMALPIALLCLAAVWIPHPHRILKAVLGAALLLVFAIPAGLHGQAKLHFFAPFGNPYLNQIYAASGDRNIVINLGRDGRYEFGSPSFYNATFYPFSGWSTDRIGTAFISVDLTQGKEGWLLEKERLSPAAGLPQIPDRLGEPAVYRLWTILARQ
jgi:hypothetical protein